MKQEIWKDIAGYEGKYQVSNLGRVKSLNYKRSGKEEIMEPYKVGGGYLQVHLCKNGERDKQYVHRLVAEAFLPNPENLPFVNHKDENPENNIVSNLEWCNAKYNTNYGTRNDRVAEKLINREDLSKPVLCVETGEIFPSSSEAERKSRAYQGNIIKCCQGKRKTTRGYHWRYAD